MPSPSRERGPWATLRTRLTLWNTAVVLLTTAVALAAVRLGMRAALVHEADAVLRGEVEEVALALGERRTDMAAIVDALQRKAASHSGRGWFSHLLSEDGRTIWRSNLCPDEVALYPPQLKNQLENVVQLGSYRYLRRRIVGPDAQPVHLRIGMSTDALEARVDTLTRLLLVVGGVLALLTPLAAWWLAGRATRPVADILHTAERLRPTSLGDRLRVRGTDDELDRLALTINRLLDEVAGHVERQQQFIADAAHELRGPLAAMRSSLEVAIAHERSPDEYRSTLADVLDASRQLSSLANALLTLAEATDDGRSLRRDPLDLGALAAQTVAMFTGVAEDRGVALVRGRTSRVTVTGDPTQLRQVIGNLVDNALRFTPTGGRVVVDIESDTVTGAAVLTVTDTGSGIDPRHVDRVFDRFFKADAARSHASEDRSGGLGLAICKAIVERHRGSISIRSRPGAGTTVTVRLPAAHASSTEAAAHVTADSVG